MQSNSLEADSDENSTISCIKLFHVYAQKMSHERLKCVCSWKIDADFFLANDLYLNIVSETSTCNKYDFCYTKYIHNAII